MPNLRLIAQETDCRAESAKAEKLSVYKGGGQVDCLLVPNNAEEFCRVYRAMRSENRQPYVLGGGSNTLIADGTVNVPVISTKELNSVFVKNEAANSAIVKAEAGVGVSRLLAVCRGNGLCGLEFLIGIPASVGGLIRMNAGAFGQQTADYLYKITVLNPETGEIIEKTPSAYSYRSGEKGIVLSAEFLLRRGSKEEFCENAARFVAERRLRQPAKPSLGSVFKNPPGDYAARLIEQSGMKGRRVGGAEISFKHANFIVNVGGGSAGDYLKLCAETERRVYEAFGVKLEREFILLE